MFKIEIIADHGKYKRGQVVNMTATEMGHATAFKYGRPWVAPKIEAAVQAPPETREVNIEINPIEQSEPSTFFKRRGRRPK